LPARPLRTAYAHVRPGCFGLPLVVPTPIA
jgi:hypothetical protein